MLAKKATGLTEGPEFEAALADFKKKCESEKKDVISAGGLYIVGTERHDSRRIDNQLRGRAGRQGDPGESRFYLSFEDALIRKFNGEMMQKLMDRMNLPDDEPIVAGMVSRSIEGAQRKVEGHNFDIRKHLLDYDDVMNQQRTIIYGMRKKIMEGDGVERTYLDMLGDVTSAILETYTPELAKKEQWNLEGLKTSILQQFGIRLELPAHATVEIITDLVGKVVKEGFDRQKATLNQFYDQIQKMILLQSIDHHWKEHLARIDRLKEGINLRGYAQKDPLIEYKKEAFGAFEVLNHTIKSDAIEKFMKIQIVSQEQASGMNEMLKSPDLKELDYQGASEPTGSANEEAPAGAQASSEGKQRMKMRAGPPTMTEKSGSMNREERRKLEKNKRR